MSTTNSDATARRLSPGRQLERNSLHRQVGDRLIDLITAGETGSEVVLPPERELAADLGIGRNSLREAIASLDRLGIIETRGRARVGLVDRARAHRMARVPAVSPSRSAATPPAGVQPTALTETEQRVVDAIAERAEELVRMTRTLVGFDTRVRDAGGAAQEADLQAYLAEHLERHGAQVSLGEPEPALVAGHPMIPDGFTFAGRPQLVARFRGNRRGPRLLFNGHIDTVDVAPFERWRHDPFAAVIEDGAVHGRGACDMKGGVACMVIAAEAVAALAGDLPGELIVNTVTDEESTGAGGLATARTIEADAAIIPEPSGQDAWIACRGSLIQRITVTGRAGHAGIAPRHPDVGGAVNAIEKMAIVLDAIRRLRDEWALRPPHPYLSPADCVPVLVSGGEWLVSYPERCTLDCHIEYLPDQADDSGGGSRVEDEFRDWIHRAAQADPWLAAHPPVVEEVVGSVSPAEIPADDPIVSATLEASAALGRPALLGGLDNWHDGATLTTEAGIPALCFGPGDIHQAHTLTEHVRIADLVSCAQTLAVAAIRFRSGGPA
ncbi:MAG TPA: ArgE/DapE family deacylase [Gaiellales bacterium]|nr:ArgE/DapE family deacylase [Gaiellales bacterium]